MSITDLTFDDLNLSFTSKTLVHSDVETIATEDSQGIYY